MSGAWKNGEDADIDLAGLFGAIWRRRMLVLASTVCLGALGFAGASVVSPKYQSEARVLIEERSPELATLRITPLEPLGSLDEVVVEGERLLEFGAPGAVRRRVVVDVRHALRPRPADDMPRSNA